MSGSNGNAWTAVEEMALKFWANEGFTDASISAMLSKANPDCPRSRLAVKNKRQGLGIKVPDAVVRSQRSNGAKKARQSKAALPKPPRKTPEFGDFGQHEQRFKAPAGQAVRIIAPNGQRQGGTSLA